LPPSPTAIFSPQTYPRVDGSTATIPLSEAVAAVLMGLAVEEARPYVLHNKTHEAYVNLINGLTDIIFVTSPSEEELLLAQQKGIVLEVVPIVSEGFVFLASSDNPVEGLSVEQIRRIYTGEIINWSEVGGADVPIVAYQRPVNSGSQTGFLDLVMKDLVPMTPPKERVLAMMGELIDAVAAYDNAPDALGYSYYYFVTDMWGNDQVKLLEVDGVYPDKATISSGLYPFRTAYYAVIRSNETEDAPVRKMLEWILSDEGQDAVEAAGYVKVR
jgi:phosphate transport system substrate-binding protein